MRRLLVALAAVVALGFPAAGAAQTAPPVVYVANLSSLPQAEVDAVLPAFQIMVDRDLGPAWNVQAELTTDPAAEKSATMVVYIEDNATCLMCLGYHDVVNGRPVAYVFVNDSAAVGEDVWIVFGHELEEMLVDPWINRLALSANRTYLVEVADPVESGYYAYWITTPDGVRVPISDFVLQGWYTGKGPYDFTHRLKRPRQVGRHGYVSWWEADGWHQTFA